MIEFAAVTDIGSVRSENQDRWFADAKIGLFLVADGLGGHAAGGLAAQLAVDILPRLVRRRLAALTPGPSPEYGRGETGALTPGPSPEYGRGETGALTPGPSPEYGRGETGALTPGPSPEYGRGETTTRGPGVGHCDAEVNGPDGDPWRRAGASLGLSHQPPPLAALTPSSSPEYGRGEIAEQVKILSNLVYKETHGQPGVNGTGTTIALALVDATRATIVHAGDSRAYLLRQGELRQITQDHTLGQLLVRNHEMSAAAVGKHPAARRLTRYIGMPGRLTPDSQTIAFAAGDLLLLCSDGLHGQIDDSTISRILRSGKSIEAMGHALVAACNRAGGCDNVTVLLISRAE